MDGQSERHSCAKGGGSGGGGAGEVEKHGRPVKEGRGGERAGLDKRASLKAARHLGRGRALAPRLERSRTDCQGDVSLVKPLRALH